MVGSFGIVNLALHEVVEVSLLVPKRLLEPLLDLDLHLFVAVVEVFDALLIRVVEQAQVVLEPLVNQAFVSFEEVSPLARVFGCDRIEHCIVRSQRRGFLLPHDAAQTLEHLLPGTVLDVDFDSHIGIGQVDCLISNSAEK